MKINLEMKVWVKIGILTFFLLHSVFTATFEQNITHTSGGNSFSIKMNYDLEADPMFTALADITTATASYSRFDDIEAIGALTDNTFTISVGASVTAIMIRLDGQLTPEQCDSTSSSSDWRMRITDGTVTESSSTYSFADTASVWILTNTQTGSLVPEASGFNITETYTRNSSLLLSLSEFPSDLLCWFTYTAAEDFTSPITDLDSAFGTAAQIAIGTETTDPVVDPDEDPDTGSTGKDIGAMGVNLEESCFSNFPTLLSPMISLIVLLS